MSKYQVFEISKNGKRIIESDLSLEDAESLSHEVSKSNLENVYGYEPDAKVVAKMDIEKVKEIFAMSSEERQEKIKEFMTDEDLKELDKIGKGIVVGESYNFLFEGENNEYDEEYKDYINGGKKIVKMDNKFQEVINLLKNETKNLDDNEMLSFNVSFVKDIIEELERKEKNTIAKILAYVEKNHDAPEIEEYLWKMLDKGTEFE